jgi:hypothetical protein
MTKFDFVTECINVAKREAKAHEQGKREHPCWYSGHQGKAVRAIQMAQEALQEIKNELREGPRP